MADPDEALRELLGAEPPGALLALDAVTRDLAGVIADARRHQARSLAEAFEATLKHVPFPVRGVVKRVLGA
jgi:hypothetical protein